MQKNLFVTSDILLSTEPAGETTLGLGSLLLNGGIKLVDLPQGVCLCLLALCLEILLVNIKLALSLGQVCLCLFSLKL